MQGILITCILIIKVHNHVTMRMVNDTTRNGQRQRQAKSKLKLFFKKPLFIVIHA